MIARVVRLLTTSGSKDNHANLGKHTTSKIKQTCLPRTLLLMPQKPSEQKTHHLLLLSMFFSRQMDRTFSHCKLYSLLSPVSKGIPSAISTIFLGYDTNRNHTKARPNLVSPLLQTPIGSTLSAPPVASLPQWFLIDDVDAAAPDGKPLPPISEPKPAMSSFTVECSTGCTRSGCMSAKGSSTNSRSCKRGCGICSHLSGSCCCFCCGRCCDSLPPACAGSVRKKSAGTIAQRQALYVGQVGSVGFHTRAEGET